jgi:hypothetical protein
MTRPTWPSPSPSACSIRTFRSSPAPAEIGRRQHGLVRHRPHHQPLRRFADSLALAVAAPQRFRLIELLTSLPETPLAEPHQPPHGHWILCGYGRFGHAVAERLRNTGIRLTIIDPTASDADHDIIGDGTEASTLHQAGIAEARASSPAATTTSTTCRSR